MPPRRPLAGHVAKKLGRGTWTPAMIEAAVPAILELLRVVVLPLIGPDQVRRAVDEWEAAWQASEAAERAKFGDGND